MKKPILFYLGQHSVKKTQVDRYAPEREELSVYSDNEKLQDQPGERLILYTDVRQ